MRVINNNYDRGVKESSLSLPGDIHTQGSALASTYHMQQEENKTLSTQLYLARLTRQEERKDSKDMQGYLACGFIAFVGSITKRVSLYSIFINGRIGSLTNCNTLGVWLPQYCISFHKHVHHLSHHAIVTDTCICNIHNCVCFILDCL